MSIYSSSKIVDNEAPVIEGVSPDAMPMYDIFMESCNNDLTIMEAIHSYDMAEIEGMRKISALKEASDETDDVDDDEDVKDAEKEIEKILEAEGENIFDKIIAALKAAWKKIAEFFKGLLDHLKGYFGSVESFLKVYGNKIDNIGKFESFKVKGYSFPDRSNVAGNIDKQMADVAKVNANLYRIAKVDSYEKLGEIRREDDDTRNSTAHALNLMLKIDVTDDNVNGALFDYFHGADAYRKGKLDLTIDGAAIKEYKNWLTKFDALSKAIKKVQDDVNKVYSDTIKAANNAKNSLKNDDSKLKSAKIAAFNAKVKDINAYNRAAIRVVNTWSSATVERAGFYRSVCLKALSVAKKGAKAADKETN